MRLGAGSASLTVTTTSLPSASTRVTLWLFASCVTWPRQQAACKAATRADATSWVASLVVLTAAAACFASASTRRLARQSIVDSLRPLEHTLSPMACTV